jgi:hypothetical protein
MEAPKNKKNHIKIENSSSEFTNGIGMALIAANAPRNDSRYSAFLEVYPPILCIRDPPNITPSIGAEIVSVTKVGKMTGLSTYKTM